MKIYNLTVDDHSLALIQTALGEMAWNARNLPAGKNYRELSKNIKEQVINQ